MCMYFPRAFFFVSRLSRSRQMLFPILARAKTKTRLSVHVCMCFRYFTSNCVTKINSDSVKPLITLVSQRHQINDGAYHRAIIG